MTHDFLRIFGLKKNTNHERLVNSFLVQVNSFFIKKTKELISTVEQAHYFAIEQLKTEFINKQPEFNHSISFKD